MRTKRYYFVRTVARIAFWLSLTALIFTASNHINWVDDHWCFKTISQCYEGGK